MACPLATVVKEDVCEEVSWERWETASFVDCGRLFPAYGLGQPAPRTKETLWSIEMKPGLPE